MRLVKHPAAASRAAAEERLEQLRKRGTDSPFQAPLIFDHFRLEEDGMEVEGKPTLSQYTDAGGFIAHAEHGGPFWLADWLNYGDTRSDWAKHLDQAQAHDLSRYKADTIEVYRRVAKKVPKERRRPELTFNHHKAVESLAPEEQIELLGKAVDHGWSVSETRREGQALQKRGVLKGQAPLAGKYRVWYVDFPWLYNDRGAITEAGAYGRADKHYPGLTIEQGCKIPVKAHAHKDAVMFFWVTSPMLAECWAIIEAWGFTYKTSIVWDKVLHNFGHYVGIHHELLLICTRGSCTPDRPTPQPDSVQTIRRSDVHSEKPPEFAALIEKLYDGPYVELFARKPRAGWTTWGNQILSETLVGEANVDTESRTAGGAEAPRERAAGGL